MIFFMYVFVRFLPCLFFCKVSVNILVSVSLLLNFPIVHISLANKIAHVTTIITIRLINSIIDASLPYLDKCKRVTPPLFFFYLYVDIY